MYGSKIGTLPDDRQYLAQEYNIKKNNQAASVYSPHCVLSLTRTHGICQGCKGERDLVNNYCETCRVMGANELQCLSPQYSNRSK